MTTRSERFSKYFTYIQPVLRVPLVRTYGYAIFTIAALSIFIIFAIKPTIETIVVLDKELAVQKETLNKITEKSQNLSQGRQNYQNISASTKTKIQAAVPKNADVASVVKSLEAAALSSQASISALQFQPITIEKGGNPKEPRLAEITFIYNLEGSYETLKTILDNLKNSSRLISIDSIIFNKTDSANLLMSVTGKAYYLQ